MSNFQSFTLLILSPLMLFAQVSSELMSKPMPDTETKLILDQKSIMSLSGHARAAGYLDALVFYRPSYVYADISQEQKNELGKACQFEEDIFTANGSMKIVKVLAKREGDQYSMQIPTSGQRANCPYLIDSIKLMYKDGTAQAHITLVTDLEAARFNRVLTAPSTLGFGTFSPREFYQLEVKKNIECELDQDIIGLCRLQNTSLSHDLIFSHQPTNYVLNFIKAKID